MSALLEARGLSVRFGGVQAVADVDLEVRHGQLVGLIGPNGAGKTTFIDALTGFVHSTGHVTLDGVDLDRLAPHERAWQGLGRTWQAAELFDDLSVRENLAVAARRPALWQAVRQLVSRQHGDDAAVREALELAGLGDWAADMMPTDLSQGQRKLVGVARAIAMGPRVLCLDEPAAGLDTEESRQLGQRLHGLVDGGASLLLIDHDMGLVLGICDYVYVLEFGRLIAAGPPDEVRSDPRVVSAYLGSAAEAVVDRAEGGVA